VGGVLLQRRELGNPSKPAWEFRSLRDHGVLISMVTD